MTFVWKTTCRRLQSTGALARFAQGQSTEREGREIETHLAGCPDCRATVADTLFVVSTLNANLPAAPSGSLAGSGRLWASLEAEIARTPQDPAVRHHSVSDPAASPRLQRFGRWLAAPGAMPFGTVAAAAVVGMVGIVVYQRSGFSPVGTQTASVSTVGESEITILPSPGAPTRSTAGVAASTAAVRKPLARASAPPAPFSFRAADAIKVAAGDNNVAPLETKMSARRSRSLVAPARMTFSPAPPRPPAPRAAVVQMAKATSPESPAASASALSAPSGPAQAAETVRPNTGSLGGGIGGNGGSPTGVDNILSNDADNTVLPAPAPAMMGRTQAVPSPMPVAPGAIAFATVSRSGENVSSEAQDVPAARSLLDMALRQRRQRSLFSYATR